MVSQAGLVYLVHDRFHWGDIGRRAVVMRPVISGGAVLSVKLTAGVGRDGLGGLINIRCICAHFWKKLPLQKSVLSCYCV